MRWWQTWRQEQVPSPHRRRSSRRRLSAVSVSVTVFLSSPFRRHAVPVDHRRRRPLRAAARLLHSQPTPCRQPTGFFLFLPSQRPPSSPAVAQLSSMSPATIPTFPGVTLAAAAESCHRRHRRKIKDEGNRDPTWIWPSQHIFGFTSWNKPERLREHVGCHDSTHNKDWKKCEDLMNQEQSIQSALQKQSDQARSDYRIRLNASVDCIGFFLRQGLAFRGHDESETSKNQDILRESQAAKVVEALKSGEVKSGRGLNQERGLQHPGDIRWSPHYETLIGLIVQFSAITDVLEYIVEEGLNFEQRAEANVLLGLIQSFNFIFNLHMMKDILGITDELSKALQRKDQVIVNVIELVESAKERLFKMRNDGWDDLMTKVCLFCDQHDIRTLKMDDMFVFPGKSARKVNKVTNLHHYRVDLFIEILDRQLKELDNRFTETSTELLFCVACLNPDDSFSTFNKQRLIRLGQFYPSDFSAIELMALDSQLDTYILDMCSNSNFQNVKGISALAQKLVCMRKHIVYPLVYQLVKLALILPVVTASVEKAFSVMNIVKNQLRNRMGDQLMNDCLVAYIEKDVFDGISNEMIMQRFQAMKPRRGQL